jgi:hypothetical protein
MADPLWRFLAGAAIGGTALLASMCGGLLLLAWGLPFDWVIGSWILEAIVALAVLARTSQR